MYGEIQNCFQQGRRSCPKPYGIELFVGWDKLPATALGFPPGVLQSAANLSKL